MSLSGFIGSNVGYCAFLDLMLLVSFETSCTLVFQYIVLMFGPDSWEILLIFSKVMSFATF